MTPPGRLGAGPPGHPEAGPLGRAAALPFLGRGWGFPPRFSLDGAGVDLAEGAEDVRQSLDILISTAPGERVMLPAYGCDLARFAFRKLSTGLATEMADVVRTAILLWEPRIDLLSVEVEPGLDAASVHIAVAYAIRRTNVRTNVVFPFHLLEATLVEAP